MKTAACIFGALFVVFGLFVLWCCLRMAGKPNDQKQERDQLIKELTEIAKDPAVLKEAEEQAREVGMIDPDDLHRPFTI